MGKTFAVKSRKAIYSILVSFVAFVAFGIYLLITFNQTNENMFLLGIILIAIGVIVFIVGIPSLFSPKDIMLKADDHFVINTLFHKDLVIKFNEIKSFRAIVTFRRYFRPLNQDYYTYGTLILKLENKSIYMPNIEDIAYVEEVLNGIVKH